MGLCRLLVVLSFLISSAFADSEKEKIFTSLATLPKVSMAKIKRGKNEITVDLSSPQAKSLIKDYDVLYLNEGVYTTLGNFTAKYVRVRGQGTGKTFLTSMPKGSTPILVNSTELWDMTVADGKFKLQNQQGLWAVNVEFAGSILVTPANLSQTPVFAIRSVFSDLTLSDLPTEDHDLYSHFLSKKGESYLMPLPGDIKELVEKRTAQGLLAYEDKFDQTKDLNLKDRIGYKGLFARGLNYLYQKDVLSPKFNLAKYKLLVMNARSTKAKGHLYVSMLYWAEADRLSGHSRFDEVLKEITPLTQRLGQECGCTVEGQGLASTIKSEIEQNLYTNLPITALPGKCTIQTLSVVVPEGSKKETVIASARLQHQMNRERALKTSEEQFEKSVIAHAKLKFEEMDGPFLVGASAPSVPENVTTVADVELPGMKKSFTSDEGNINQSIIDVIKEKFAVKLKEAKVKIASSDLKAKFDGLLVQVFYGAEIAEENSYDEMHEQQFGRKLSATGAMSSVMAY